MNDIILDESDLEFFKSLPGDEKLIFLHDLLCTDSYLNNEDVTDNEFDDTSFDNNTLDVFKSDYLKDFETRITNLISDSIRSDVKVNVTILTNIVVLNSNNLSDLRAGVSSLATNFGMILFKLELKEELVKIFKKQSYCKVYYIIGYGQKLLNN